MIEATFYIVLGIFVISKEVRRVAGSNRIKMITICGAIYGILCCIIPGLILFNEKGIQCQSSNNLIPLYSLFLTIVCYISLQIGYKFGGRETKEEETTKIYSVNNMLLTATIFLIISVFALYQWSSGYGGITQTIMLGSQIRASSVLSHNAFTFFKHFVPLSILSSLLIFTECLILKKRTHNIIYKTYAFLIFTVSVIISLIYIIANDGRTLAGAYILFYVLIFIKYKFEIEEKSIVRISIILLCVVGIIWTIIIKSEEWFAIYRQEDYDIENSRGGFINTLLSEFSFIYTSLYNAIAESFNSTYVYTICNDFVNGIFAWLPTSLKPLTYIDVWDYNTKLINTGGYGQIPVNIVGQTYYDLGILGVMLIPAIYAWIIRKIEIKLDNDKMTTLGLVIYVVLGFYFGKSMAYFSVYNIMINIFYIVIGLLLYNRIFKHITY